MGQPVPRQRDDGVHVHGVQVGALTPVDLHVDEVLVHQGGGLVVLERLVLHDVAPVAGGVPDREQDRLVLVAGAGLHSSPHGYQSTGLSACCSRYGLVSHAETVHADPFLHEAAVTLNPERDDECQAECEQEAVDRVFLEGSPAEVAEQAGIGGPRDGRDCRHDEEPGPR